MALAIAVTAGVNYRMISDSMQKAKYPLRNLFAIANVEDESNSLTTMTLPCEEALMKTCEGRCSKCGKRASSKGKSPVSVSCNCD